MTCSRPTMSMSTVTGMTTVYYEIVQLKESGPTAKEDTWGVLATRRQH